MNNIEKSTYIFDYLFLMIIFLQLMLESEYTKHFKLCLMLWPAGLPLDGDDVGWYLAAVEYDAAVLLLVLHHLEPVLRIRMFLGLLNPDPLVRGMDPDPSITKQK